MQASVGSNLAISICNRSAYPIPSCLLRMDPETGQRDWIDVGLGRLLASGIGICADKRYLYHLSLLSPDLSTSVSVLDRASLEVVHTQALPDVEDAHSVVRFGDELVVASTETDQILAYPLDDCRVGKARVVWRASDSMTDTHHINSLAVSEDGRELFCSAFGPREHDSWATARNGYIRNVSTGEVVLGGLRQPHSATWQGGQLYYCNSLEGSVNVGDDVLAYLYGYSRGLAFGANGTLYTGTSLSRRPSAQESEDTGVFRNPGDAGDLHGVCALIQMTETGTNRVEMALGEFGNEIYDIFVL